MPYSDLDKETKPAAIEQRIGRIPIFVAGHVRTGGDIAQLTYSETNSLPNFQLLINHDDDVREFAYAEKDNTSLNAAEEGGWHVVSMKNDWLKKFSFRKLESAFDSFRAGLGEFPGHLDQRNHSRKPLKIQAFSCPPISPSFPP